jgi:prepilin-type processing-associated H-X9-DG protein
MPDEPLGNPPRLQFGLGSLFVVTAVVALLLALVFPAFQAARNAARKSACANELKQLAMGVHNYSDSFRILPRPYWPDAEGKPIHSWRMATAPFLEPDAHYSFYSWKEPWDGPNNRDLHGINRYVLHCPSDTKVLDQPITNYVVATGPGTLWPVDRALRIKCEDIPGSTILFVETRDCGIHWLEPRDLNHQTMTFSLPAPPGEGISSMHPGGANAALGDGSVRWLPWETDPDVLRQMFLIPPDATPGKP